MPAGEAAPVSAWVPARAAPAAGRFVAAPAAGRFMPSDSAAWTAAVLGKRRVFREGRTLEKALWHTLCIGRKLGRRRSSGSGGCFARAARRERGHPPARPPPSPSGPSDSARPDTLRQPGTRPEPGARPRRTAGAAGDGPALSRLKSDCTGGRRPLLGRAGFFSRISRGVPGPALPGSRGRRGAFPAGEAGPASIAAPRATIARGGANS